jgi:hypothetical protein
MLGIVVGPLLGAVLAMPPVVAADHHATVVGDHVLWETIVVTPPYQRSPDAIMFQNPLANGAVMEEAAGVQPLVGASGQLQGAALDWNALPYRPGRKDETQTVTLRIRLPADGAQLHAPLVVGPPVQRVVLEGGWMFEPKNAAGLERHVGYWLPRDLDSDSRRAVDRLLPDRHVPPGTMRLYVRDGPLEGRFTSPQQHRARGTWLVMGAFPVTMAGLWVAWKTLSKKVEEQRVDAIIRGAFDDLER